jgi:hypothetical protein
MAAQMHENQKALESLKPPWMLERDAVQAFIRQLYHLCPLSGMWEKNNGCCQLGLDIRITKKVSGDSALKSI